jgi:[acyl-carrier-protein] S-malonyltransferase
MTLAILCSGQAWQGPGMFSLTGSVPETAELFARAAILLGGTDPREFVRTETAEILHRNRVGQILCALQALAAATALREVMPDRVVVAGYSVGEVAAWGVAGLLRMSDTLELVASRAEAMDAASCAGDGLLYVRGLPRDVIDGLCERHQVEIAIINPQDAFVLGGSRVCLDAFANAARAMQASKVVDLPVAVASHTTRLSKASIEFRAALKHVSVQFPTRTGTRVLSGVDGTPIVSVDTSLDKLAAQISQTVCWSDCLQGCIEAGATVFLELGPGHALSGMAATTYRDASARSLDDFKTLQGVRSWLTLFTSRGSH